MKSTTHQSGFSLVLSLIILTLLSILVISFLSTTTLDRMTASAFANKTKAELAADMAVNQAVALLADTITQYPDSATVWEPLLPNGGTVPTTEGTVLYYSDGTPGDTNGTTHLLPLFSRGVDADGQPLGSAVIGNKAATLSGDGWDDKNSINLNRPRSNGDLAGWIGTPPTPIGGTAPTTPKPFRAKWNEIKEAAPQPGSTAPRVISRYAFWVEDESFKVNLNQLGNLKRGSEKTETTRETANGDHPVNRTPFQGLLRSAHATPVYTPNFDAAVADTLGTSARNLRDGFIGKRLLEAAAFNHADSSYNLGDDTKFLSTIFSGGLNVSRHGSQRLNLNGLGFEQSSQSVTDAELGVKRIVETIHYHAPKFYQRFYRNSPPASTPTAGWLNAENVAPAHEDPYLYKIAANIRDYIDPDSNPTMITDQGKIATRTPPQTAFGDSGNVMWAQGKEGLYLQEAAVRERIDNKSNKLRYDLKVDYYIEYWNMTDADIYALPPGTGGSYSLGANPFVRISGQQRWLAVKDGSELKADNTPPGNPTEGPDRDMVIDIANGVVCQGVSMPFGVVFKKGQATVITTDPDYAAVVQVAGGSSPNFSGGINPVNTYVCNNLLKGKRKYAGPVPGPYVAATGGVKPEFRDGAEDYDTEVILGNDFGYIDSLPCAIAMGGSAVVTNDEIDDHWYGGTLLGNNTTYSQLGDPRTNNEQLIYTRFISGGSITEPDQTRYYNTTNVPRFSLGYPNDRYLNPQNTYKWPDYYKGWPYLNPGIGKAANPSGPAAPSYIANVNLTSIGQLGDIFDPARVAGNVGSNNVPALLVQRSRGGGRTLKIGQKDDLVDTTTANAASQQWAAWRLTDFFGTTSDLLLPGLININGLRRDSGAALRAACYGLTFNSVSWAVTPANATVVIAPDLEFKSGETDTVGLQNVITQAITRLSQTDPAKPSYFRERGEISDLTAYSSATAEMLTGTKGSETFDRTREELFRRLGEMITTRGNIFSVYAVGQTIQEGNDPAKTKRVTGQHTVKVTFALIPKKADNSDFQVKTETFAPTRAAQSIKDRFAKPDHYDVLFLQVNPQ